VALSSFFFHSIFVLASSVEIYIYTFLFFKASQDAFLNNQVKGIKKKKKKTPHAHFFTSKYRTNRTPNTFSSRQRPSTTSSSSIYSRDVEPSHRYLKMPAFEYCCKCGGMIVISTTCTSCGHQQCNDCPLT
jgi:hypothetical protein